MESEELERICFNCSYFFPASEERMTEYGICLYDEAFEPFAEELLENCNYSSCKELIEEKRFHGDTKACKHFEESEMIEIDDETHLGKELKKLEKSGKLDMEAIETAILYDKIDKIDWKTLPVDGYLAGLNSSDKSKQLKAVSSLAGLANLGNKKARNQLIKYFKNLPTPSTLAEVHFKMRVFDHVEYIKNKSDIVPLLINELYYIQSNNTTRQWIAKILKYLERCPADKVCGPLEKLLQKRKFSYRLKNKIQNTIIICKENQV